MGNTMQPLKSLYETAYFMEKCLGYISLKATVVLVQLLSPVWLFTTPWTAAQRASLFFTISWSLLKLMSTESVMTSNHLVLCVPFSSCLLLVMLKEIMYRETNDNQGEDFEEFLIVAQYSKIRKLGVMLVSSSCFSSIIIRVISWQQKFKSP